MGGNKFRVSYKKASTGCGTCRTRRVKCDEQKPFCHRCQIAGRVCDGYRTQNNFVVFVAPQTRARLSDGFHDDIERRFFDYFRSISASEFSRFFDENIWGRLVLQAAHSVPAVKHAVVAVASSHESFKSESTYVPWNLPKWPNARAHAQGEYNKAIQQLRMLLEREGDQCLPVVLTCGLLFCCLEMLGGNALGALTHLEACIKILNSITTKPVSASQDIIYIQPQTPLVTDVKRDLVPVFTRLDSMASQGVIGRVPSLKLKKSSPLDDPNVDLSCLFSSFSEAGQALYIIEHAEHVLFHSHLLSRYGLEATHQGFSATLVQPLNSGHVALEDIAARQVNLQRLAAWDKAFTAFISKHPPRTDAESRGSMLLQANQKIMTIKFTAVMYNEETLFDMRKNLFAEVVDLCRAIISKSVPCSTGKRNPPTWSVETGIFRPLAYVAFKCRDGRLRRKALHMLERCPQEGIWNPAMEAPIYRRVMEVEEGLPRGSTLGDWPPNGDVVFKTYEDIPEWRRIYWGWKVPIPGQRKSHWFSLMLPNGPDGGWEVVPDIYDWLPEEGLCPTGGHLNN